MPPVPPTAPADDLLVRMLRLPPPSPWSFLWFLAILGLAAGGGFLLWFYNRQREAARLRGEREESMKRLVSAARLNGAEAEAFREVARCSGMPAALCSKVVELFDRGVEMVLHEPLGEIERVERIRTLRNLRRKLGLHVSRRGAPIRSTRMLPANQPVLVTPPVPPHDAGPIPGTLLSTNEDALMIRLDGPPAEAARPLRAHEEVDVMFFSPGDASYTFRARVAALRELGAAFLVLMHPPTLNRIQKRGFERIELTERVRFFWLPESQMGSLSRLQKTAQTGPELLGVISSLSGSGFRLRTGSLLEVGDFISLCLPFLPPPLATEVCFGRVVRAREGTYGFTFEGMSPRVQAGILHFVRHLQSNPSPARAAEVHTPVPEPKPSTPLKQGGSGRSAGRPPTP